MEDHQAIRLPSNRIFKLREISLFDRTGLDFTRDGVLFGRLYSDGPRNKEQTQKAKNAAVSLRNNTDRQKPQSVLKPPKLRIKRRTKRTKFGRRRILRLTFENNFKVRFISKQLL